VRSGLCKLYVQFSLQKPGLEEKDRLVDDAEDNRMSEYVTEEKLDVETDTVYPLRDIAATLLILQ
jgi:hypothetical protein